MYYQFGSFKNSFVCCLCTNGQYNLAIWNWNSNLIYGQANSWQIEFLQNVLNDQFAKKMISLAKFLVFTLIVGVVPTVGLFQYNVVAQRFRLLKSILPQGWHQHELGSWPLQRHFVLHRYKCQHLQHEGQRC